MAEQTIEQKKLAWEADQRRYNMIRIWQKRYAHMLARQRGVASNQSAGAKGKPICSREEFFEWCKQFDNITAFMGIYFDWAANGFQRWDSPSIDRIDPNRGYEVDNLQWLSFGDNCKKNNINPVDHSEGGW